MTKAVWGAAIRLAIIAILGLAVISCGTVARDGTASSFLIVKSIEGASGAKPDEYGGTLLSDVQTIVEESRTIFNDLARVELTLALKDPGSPANPAAPSQANWVTVNRYRVRYIRTDGRNTEGVDVPYTFDSAVTATVAGDTMIGFTIVRHQAKQEAPLRALIDNRILVSAIAEVTFFGHDQTGRAVSVTANIGVTFGNFADPV